jgi:hypothetical protein
MGAGGAGGARPARPGGAGGGPGGAAPAPPRPPPAAAPRPRPPGGGRPPAPPPDADGLRHLAMRVNATRVRAVIESMNGARFVHDTLEQLGSMLIGQANSLESDNSHLPSGVSYLDDTRRSTTVGFEQATDMPAGERWFGGWRTAVLMGHSLNTAQSSILYYYQQLVRQLRAAGELFRATAEDYRAVDQGARVDLEARAAGWDQVAAPVDAGEEDRVLVADELRDPDRAHQVAAVAAGGGAGAHHPLGVADLDPRPGGVRAVLRGRRCAVAHRGNSAPLGVVLAEAAPPEAQRPCPSRSP